MTASSLTRVVRDPRTGTTHKPGEAIRIVREQTDMLDRKTFVAIMADESAMVLLPEDVK